jgi:type IV secretion system protein VirB8
MELERRYIDENPVEAAAVRAQAVAALDFAEETVREAQTSRRHAWWVTALLILTCAAQAAAIAIMLPLKDVVPYTILVDKQTGYMETVRGIQVGALKDDEAVVASFLAQYVLQRETFDPADFEERYKRVALWSTDQARTDYIDSYKSGPQSVLAGMRPGSTVAVRVKNIDILSNNTARVRFDLTQRDPGYAPETAVYQTFVTFRFTGAPMRMEDRLVNPLGFQVTGYRRDAEFVTAAAQAPAVMTLSAKRVSPTPATPALAGPQDTVQQAAPEPQSQPQDVPMAVPPKSPGPPPKADQGPQP